MEKIRDPHEEKSFAKLANRTSQIFPGVRERIDDKTPVHTEF